MNFLQCVVLGKCLGVQCIGYIALSGHSDNAMDLEVMQCVSVICMLYNYLIPLVVHVELKKTVTKMDMFRTFIYAGTKTQKVGLYL